MDFTRPLATRESLSGAIAAGQMVQHYQPIVDLVSRSMVGCESLMRWEHPCEGTVAACEFSELLERTGLVDGLTLTLIGEACRLAADLSPGGARRFVSVNMSPAQLSDPALVGLVRHELAAAGIEGDQLTLEITEYSTFGDLPTAARVLTKLRDLGVKVALDDFGTGHSSLIKLKQLPISVVKRDGQFLVDLPDDGVAMAIVGSVVNLAASLGMECVAEGVETIEQAHALRLLGCDRAQGHLFAPALPRQDLLGGIADERRNQLAGYVTGWTGPRRTSGAGVLWSRSVPRQGRQCRQQSLPALWQCDCRYSRSRRRPPAGNPRSSATPGGSPR